MVACADLESVEPKSHLIVVANKEAFKPRAMAGAEAEELPQSSNTEHSSDGRAITPSHARRSERTSLRNLDSSKPASAPSPAPALALSPATQIAEAPVPSAAFRKYDLNGDGVLDKDEVINMMQSLGYKADEGYLNNMMEAFASFDDDDSGLIEPHEFELLYAHLVCARPLPIDTTAMRSPTTIVTGMPCVHVYVAGRCSRR